MFCFCVNCFFRELIIGNIYDCDEQKCESIDNTLSFGNGITASKDGKYIYVIESMPKMMNVYERSVETNVGKKHVSDDNCKADGYRVRHTKIKSVSTPSLCDNLFIDSKSEYIWSACHPSIRQVYAYQILNSPVCTCFHFYINFGDIKFFYIYTL